MPVIVSIRRMIVVLAIVLIIAPSTLAQNGGATEKVLIRASKPYSKLVARIEAMGGKTTHQYKYLDAIAAEIPVRALPQLRDLVGAGALSKDVEIPAPVVTDKSRVAGTAEDVLNIDSEGVEALSAEQIAAIGETTPNAYLINNAISRVSTLHGGGYTGNGVLVAVIDSGIRPGFPHLSLDGSVVGCEDFVGDALGCSNFANGGHGTFVAGMISANVLFTFSAASSLRNGVLANCPQCFSNPPTNTTIPMIGSAPLSSIHAFRVFGPTGGAPTSRILMAVERVIELRKQYDEGLESGKNIRVCNMSLGGPTVFAGRDLFDRAIDLMLAADVVPVLSSGNAGPSSMTVGSPGTSWSAVTVGGASLAINERVLRYSQYGAVIGGLYRPFGGTQTAYFSSRGPNADGKVDPDVVSSGFANYGQGLGSTVNSISLASGTSFASPTVAGIAAVLRQRYPTATARQIRNALITTGNPGLLDDGSGVFDRGAGYVDAVAAAAAVPAMPDALIVPGVSTKSVTANLSHLGVVVSESPVVQSFSNLLPGQRHDVFLHIPPNTAQVMITVYDVVPSLPPAQQNQLFGDDVILTVHSAKTSAIGEGDYNVFEFTVGDTWMINNPETGLMRITANGDWTNAGMISGKIMATVLQVPIPLFTAQGKIVQDDVLAFPIDIPAGVTQAEFRLGWLEDWGNYPASDIDMTLITPGGTVSPGGGTLNNPEVVVVDNPTPGTWMVLVSGYEVHTAFDKYELRVSLDGKVVK